MKKFLENDEIEEVLYLISEKISICKDKKKILKINNYNNYIKFLKKIEKKILMNYNNAYTIKKRKVKNYEL